MLSKFEIRKTLRAHRKQLTHDVVLQLSAQIAEKIKVLPAFLKSQHVGFYAAQENEVDVSVVFHQSLKMNQSLYLPVFKQKDAQCLSFYKIDRQTTFVKNKFDIDEPVVNDQKPIAADALSVLFIPLVAFDLDCHRLGRGSGCYDRYLQFCLSKPRDQRPVLIGLAYEFQKVDMLVSESWDVPMDCVVTEKEVYTK